MANDEAAKVKQQVKETEQAAKSAHTGPGSNDDSDTAKPEAPKEVPIEDLDQNLPASYDENGKRKYGMTSEEVAFADAEGAAKDAEAAAKAK